MSNIQDKLDNILCSLACDILPNGSKCLQCMNEPIVIPDTTQKPKRRRRKK